MTEIVRNHPYLVLVTAVIEREGTFLIARRSSKESELPGWWSLPGGKLESEGPGTQNVLEKTLIREISEEVGLKIESKPRLISDSTFIRSNGEYVIWLVFLCRWLSGEAMPLEDTDAVAWITPEELKDYKVSEEIKGLMVDSRWKCTT